VSAPRVATHRQHTARDRVCLSSPAKASHTTIPRNLELYKQYFNRRAEIYGELAKRLNPDGKYSERPWALPNDSQLLEELCAMEKIMESDGVSFRLIPKHRQREGGQPCIRDMIGRSPDRADAVAYLWYVVDEYVKKANRPRDAAYLPPEVDEAIRRRIAAAPRPTSLAEYLGLVEY
jgi:hypothetical protein